MKDYLVCHTDPPFGNTPSSTDGCPENPLSGTKGEQSPVVVHVYNLLNGSNAATVSVRWSPLAVPLASGSTPVSVAIPASALSPVLPSAEVTRRALQDGLKVGWSTWSYNMLGVVRLPESSVRVRNVHCLSLCLVLARLALLWPCLVLHRTAVPWFHVTSRTWPFPRLKTRARAHTHTHTQARTRAHTRAQVLTTAVCKLSTQQCLVATHIEDTAASIRVGVFAIDASYWQFYVMYDGLNISMSFSGGNGTLSAVVEPLGCSDAATNCSDYALVSMARFAWLRRGVTTADVSASTLTFAPLGMPQVRSHLEYSRYS